MWVGVRARVGVGPDACQDAGIRRHAGIEDLEPLDGGARLVGDVEEVGDLPEARVRVRVRMRGRGRDGVRVWGRVRCGYLPDDLYGGGEDGVKLLEEAERARLVGLRVRIKIG